MTDPVQMPLLIDTPQEYWSNTILLRLAQALGLEPTMIVLDDGREALQYEESPDQILDLAVDTIWRHEALGY